MAYKLDFEQKKIGDLPNSDIAKVLVSCYQLAGYTQANNNLDVMLEFIKKYYWSRHVYQIKEAFEKLCIGEYPNLVDKRVEFSPRYFGMLMKTWKTTTFPEQKPIKKVEQWIPSPDEGYYNSLVCVLTGTKSARFQEHFPNTVVKGPIVPMAWDWVAVYRHLRKLNQVDEAVGTGINSWGELNINIDAKKKVLLWIDIHYPGLPKQIDLFEKSPMLSGGTRGSGMGSRLKEQLMGK
jgi:hypothetical protein